MSAIAIFAVTPPLLKSVGAEGGWLVIVNSVSTVTSFTVSLALNLTVKTVSSNALKLN